MSELTAAVLAGVVGAVIGSWVWRRCHRDPDQYVRITEKRQAELLDHERH